MLTRSIRSFIKINRKLSAFVDNLLPGRVREDGNRYFLDHTAPNAIKTGQRVWDIGGGSTPFISVDVKGTHSLHVTGLDISDEELSAAPVGAYDKTVVADLCAFEGLGEADLIICQATLEHVHDNTGAVRAISSILNEGGRACLFLPCRNAIFARLNLLLPQKLKEKVLYFVAPEVEDHQGFPAHYDNATPSQMEKLFAANGLRVVERRIFWMSNYFMVFFPAYLVWR